MRGFFILLLGLSFFSCKKEKTLLEQTEERCHKDMQFTCDGIRGEFFFSGKINGQEFCVSTFPGEYKMRTSISTITFTPADDPAFSTDDPFVASQFNFRFDPPRFRLIDGTLAAGEFVPSVRISTPWIRDSMVHPVEEYLNGFIKEGDLPLCTQNHRIECFSNKFTFYIYWDCYLTEDPNDSYDPIRRFVPLAQVPLTPGDYSDLETVFRVSELKITETPFSKIYNITFEIECDLEDEFGLFGRLEDGVFKTQVVIPK